MVWSGISGRIYRYWADHLNLDTVLFPGFLGSLSLSVGRKKEGKVGVYLCCDEAGVSRPTGL